jgi:hypothetical protein
MSAGLVPQRLDGKGVYFRDGGQPDRVVDLGNRIAPCGPGGLPYMHVLQSTEQPPNAAVQELAESREDMPLSQHAWLTPSQPTLSA